MSSIVESLLLYSVIEEVFQDLMIHGTQKQKFVPKASMSIPIGCLTSELKTLSQFFNSSVASNLAIDAFGF